VEAEWLFCAHVQHTSAAHEVRRSC